MKNRNFGIDALRIIAMLMICLLHVINHGGIRLACPQSSWNGYMLSALIAASQCCVDVFALISGYVGCSSRNPYRNMLKVYCMVLYYSLIITFAMALFFDFAVTKQDWENAFFPLTKGGWWYFSEYMKMALFFPLLNCVILKMDQREFRHALWILLLVFSVGGCVPVVWKYAYSCTSNGFSTFWLSLMYLTGGYIRQYGLQTLFPRVSVVDRFGDHRGRMYAATYGMMILIIIFSGAVMRIAGRVCGGWLTPCKAGMFSYAGPLVLLASLLLFEGISHYTPGMITSKVIKFLTPGVFSVYIIHMHALLFRNVVENSLVAIASLPIYLLLPAVLMAACGLFLVCSIIDLPRQYIVKKIKLLFA